MVKFLFKAIFLSVVAIASALSQTYEVPPSSSTRSHVPYISDIAMEQCVISYNKSKWLANDIENSYVDQYSQSSVNAHNQKITTHSNMIEYFNKNCAGKQSESAYRAAQELNKRKKNVNDKPASTFGGRGKNDKRVATDTWPELDCKETNEPVIVVNGREFTPVKCK